MKTDDKKPAAFGNGLSSERVITKKRINSRRTMGKRLGSNGKTIEKEGTGCRVQKNSAWKKHKRKKISTGFFCFSPGTKHYTLSTGVQVPNPEHQTLIFSYSLFACSLLSKLLFSFSGFPIRYFRNILQWRKSGYLKNRRRK